MSTTKGFGYVAGPMTGIPEFNIPLFNLTATRLTSMGWSCENPADNGGDGSKPWQWYMREGIKQLMRCDTIFLLPGWEASKGACTELRLALTLGMRVFEVFPDEPDDADVLASASNDKVWARLRWAEEALRL